MTENSADYEFLLANQFFADIDAPEIQKGKLQVQLNVRKTMGVYVLTFHIEGFVIVPCDRCLDDLELPVMTDDTLKVKLGAAFSDEDDMVIVPEEDGYINVAWFMYEFIALSLPMKHVHAPGKCNKGMMGALNKHLRTSVDEEEEMNKICFREEAKDWNEALPIGNGFLGAMVFGKTGTERLQINEDSVWTGSFMERVNPDARENYTKVRYR